MRSTSLFSLFGIVFCVGTTLVACSGDDDEAAPSPRLSGKGQSCDRTADCSSKLVCIDHTCAESGTTPNNNAGSDGSGGTGTGGTGTGGTGTGGTGTGGSAGKGSQPGTGGTATAPEGGQDGESCTKHSDCATGLGCYAQRCSPDATIPMGNAGEAGSGGTVTPPPNPVLGQFGETCVLPTDCDAGLTCVPGANTGNLGVCAYTDSGVTATGKACNAECKVDADCCELPLGILTGVKSCSDLADQLTGVDCTDPGSFAAQCFVQSAYCDCNNSTWRCSNGSCNYNAACEAAGLTTLGCATLSRSGRALTPDCNDNRCRALPTDPQCANDGECEGLTVVDDIDLDTCSPGECTCYRAAGSCYRKCADDLDCPVGYACDTATHVCMSAPECSENFDCQRKHGDINWRCMGDGTCKEACSNDLDCNTGLTDLAFTMVCNDDHVCQALGCRDDIDCTDGTVRMFCVDETPVAAGSSPHSAITDGN